MIIKRQDNEWVAEQGEYRGSGHSPSNAIAWCIEHMRTQRAWMARKEANLRKSGWFKLGELFYRVRG